MSEENDKQGAEAAAAEENTVDVGALAKTVETLAGTVTGMHDNIRTLSESLTGLTTSGKADAEEEDEQEDLNVDLETLSRTDFARHLLGQMDRTIKDALKPVQQKADQTDEDFTKAQIKEQISVARKSHPDLDEWSGELKEVLKESPGLSLKRAIKIAKDENPEKAKQLAEKFKMDDADDDSGRAKGKGKKGFGGLTPGGSKTQNSTRMSQKEASESAWDEAVSLLDDPSVLNES